LNQILKRQNSRFHYGSKVAAVTMDQMDGNFVGSIYGRSSIKIVHFVVIRYQTWPPHAILVSDWSISKNIFL
jgi:hypothetical protein